jgi:hypothetical protein
MMNYRIVESNNRYDLATEVNDWIAAGWRPQGGVSFVYHSAYKETWTQAMVKEDK